MPNYVKNILILKGDEERIRNCLKSIEADATENGVTWHMEIDFNKIIPMPESIANAEEGPYTGVYKTIYEEFLKIPAETDISVRNREIIKAIKKKDNLESLLISKRVENGTIDSFIEEGLKQGNVYYKNKQEYGYATWYGWAVNNWGTKWNAMETKKVADNIIAFNTAWNGTNQIVGALSEEWPDIKFIYAYADEDKAGVNCALSIVQNGNGSTVSFKTSQSSEEFANHVWDNDIEFIERLSEELQSSVVDDDVRIKTSDNFVAYLSVYFVITYLDGSVSTTNINCDFTKPITEDVLCEIAKKTMFACGMEFKKMPTSIQYVTKEFYEKVSERLNVKSMTFNFCNDEISKEV